MKEEHSATVSRRYFLQKEVFHSSVGCPLNHGNPSACPLHEVRKMGVLQRYEWLHEQSEEDLQDFLTFCQQCLEKRKLNTTTTVN